MRSRLLGLCLNVGIGGLVLFNAEGAWAEDADAAARVQFRDVAAEADLTFVHGYGQAPPTLLVQTLAGGGAWLDYDNDGRLDVYFVQGAPIAPDSDTTPLHNALYRQSADGKFTDVTARAGVGDTGFGMGCAVGDYDNDGDVDLYVTNYGPNVLYRNNGDGTFTDVTAQAGVAGSANEWSTSAAWVDVDGNGRLDLYVANYIHFRTDHGIPCSQEGVRSLCTPREFEAQPDLFFYNNGDGTFTEQARPRGLFETIGKGLGVIPGDYDNDGDMDLYVADDLTQNLLFRNLGAGQFEEVSLFSGVGFNEDGVPESGMGVTFGDVNADGQIDLFVTNFQNETNTLYVNHGRSFFMDMTFVSGLGTSSLQYLGFGTGFVDVDNDGDLDLFSANGHIEPHVELIDETATYAQTDQLWLNDGQGRFVDRSADLGPAFRLRAVSRAAAFADYDSDGDIDIMIVNNAGPVALYRNDGGNAAGHWFGLDIRRADTGQPAYGARVLVHLGDRTLIRDVQAAGSYLAQNDPRVLVGIGAHTKPDAVEIQWHGRTLHRLADVPMATYTRIELPLPASDTPGLQDIAKVAVDTAAP